MSQEVTYPAISVTPAAGSATSANQVTQIAAEQAIQTSVASIDTKMPTVGQKTMAASSPVVIASDQSAIPVTVSGVATAANQATQITAEQAIQVSVASIDTKTPTVGQKTMAASSPVTLASDQSALAISAASLPLPAGAATETTLAAVSGKLPATLGQKAMSASLAVTLASDQSAIPVTTTTSDITASGSITIINSVPAGTATAGSAVLSGTLNGAATAAVQVTGTYTGALSLQYTVDNATWVTAGGTPFLNIATGAYSATIASAAVGIFQFETTGMIQCRITALAAVSGTAVVNLRVSRATNMVTIDNALPTGANVIGALTANQSTNVAQINGVAPLMGNGVTGTGSLRVTLASDTTSNTNALLFSQAGYNKANTPTYNVYSTTPVTTSAYVQLVASTTSAIKQLQIFDSSGQAMIIATGAAASEVDQIYVPPGGGVFNIAIAASTRISIKALSANTGSNGYLVVDYLG